MGWIERKRNVEIKRQRGWDEGGGPLVHRGGCQGGMGTTRGGRYDNWTADLYANVYFLSRGNRHMQSWDLDRKMFYHEGTLKIYITFSFEFEFVLSEQVHILGIRTCLTDNLSNKRHYVAVHICILHISTYYICINIRCLTIMELKTV